MTLDEFAVLTLAVVVVVRVSWRLFLTQLYVGNQMRLRKVLDQQIERPRRRGYIR